MFAFHPGDASRASGSDAAFRVIADDYISGYLAWRPQAGTGLGLHHTTAKSPITANLTRRRTRRLKSFEENLVAWTRPAHTAERLRLPDFAQRGPARNLQL